MFHPSAEINFQKIKYEKIVAASCRQERLLDIYFSAFYFSINAGSVVSMLLTPIFRADVQCFGGECYPLAFGVPAVLMIVSLIFFVAGTRYYKNVFLLDVLC